MEANKKQSRQISRGGALIILLSGVFISLPFLGLGVKEVVGVKKMQSEQIRTRGTVVDNLWQAFASGGAAYVPKVEFVTAGGELVIFTDGTGSIPPDYEPGDQVELLYDPDSPRDARIVTWKRLWLVPTILISVGAVILFCGVAVSGIWFWLWRLVER